MAGGLYIEVVNIAGFYLYIEREVLFYFQKFYHFYLNYHKDIFVNKLYNP